MPCLLYTSITRSAPQGIELVYGDYDTFEFTPDVFGAIIQYPAANGEVRDYKAFADRVHAKDVYKRQCPVDSVRAILHSGCHQSTSFDLH